MHPCIDGHMLVSMQLSSEMPQHRVSLSSILDSNSQKPSAAVRLSLTTSNTGLGRCKVFGYDVSSHQINETTLSAEDDFNSNILRLLCPDSPYQNDAAKHAGSSLDFNRFLCEATLRAVYAQGNTSFTVHEKQELVDNVKRAFCLTASSFQEANACAVKATPYRLAQVQAQLNDLQQDKAPLINPQQFQNATLYEEWKLQELKQLSGIKDYLRSLPSLAAQVQVRVLSAETSSHGTSCINRKSCYGVPEESQVYCTIKAVSSNDKWHDMDNECPDHITKEVVYRRQAEWHDRSPWISMTSADDHLCIKMWKKKAHSRISERPNHSELVTFLRSMSQKKKITWNGDTFMGKVMLPMDLIRTDALASASIGGKIPAKSYNLRNVQDEKLPITLELELSFLCEFLFNESKPSENLLNPPVNDLELGYDALVQVAFGMHLEGDFELDTAWKNILFCYESYFRLRREICALTVLKHLATLFQPEAEYLEIIVREMQPICKLAKEGRLRKSEYLMLSHIIALMIKPSIDIMEDFQSILPLKQSDGTFCRLLEVLSLLLSWNIDIKGITACIKRWVKVSCVQRFNKHLIEHSSSGDITSGTFSKAISLLQDDLRMLYACMKQDFLEDLALFQMCASEYYRLVSQYVIGIVGSVKAASIDFEEVTREMSLLHEVLERANVKIELIDLRSLLHDHILEMVTAVKSRMIDWVISSLRDEKWEPISPKTNALFSCSVVDLYFMINGVIENLTTRLSYFPFGKFYHLHIEESTFSVIEVYIKTIEKLCVEELTDAPHGEYNQFLSSLGFDTRGKSVCITKPLCIKLNNLHAVLQQQVSLNSYLLKRWENYAPHSNTEDFQKIVPDDSPELSEPNVCEKVLGEHFKSIHSLVRNSMSFVIGSIVQCMQKELTSRMQKFIHGCPLQKPPVIEDLQILTTYLDDHLKVLYEWSDRQVLKYFLLEIAAALVFCMEELVLNRDGESEPMTSEQHDCLEHTLKLLYDYFYGDGIGISVAEMDCICRRFCKILECSRLNTHELCLLYWKAWDRLNDEATHAPDSFGKSEERMHLQVLDFLLLLQQRDDDEAQIIVMNQKRFAKNEIMQISWKEKYQLEMPKEMFRGVAQYFKAIQTPTFNVTYSSFQRMTRW